MAKKRSMEELLQQKAKGTTGTTQPSRPSKEQSSHIKTVNVKENKKPEKVKEPRIKEKPKGLSKDEFIDFIRSGNLRYIIGIILSILLLAYIYGVFTSLKKGEVTVNVITAITTAFTSSGFIKFSMLALVIALFAVLLFFIFGRKKGTDRIFGKSDVLGSGSFATDEEKNNLTIRTKNLMEMPSFVFGQDPETGVYVGLNPACGVNANFAICGSQGTKKSWGYVRNNIVQLVKMGQSIVITDPKGEMYRDMSKYLIDEGYIVKQLNMKDMFVSDSWNALEDVNTTNIDEFCKAFIMNTVVKFDPFYDNMDLQLLKALCLYVKYEDKNIKDEERTLGQAYNMLEQNTEQELDDKFLSLSHSSKAYQTYMLWMKGSNAKKNSMVSLSGRFNIFQNPLVKKITGVTDIDLKLPAYKKCAYFIILNDTNPTHNLIASIFINSMLEKLVSIGYNSDTGHTDIPIHFLFDEFPIVGRINDFNVKLGTLRGYGVGVSIIFQNLPQFKNRYPDNEWEELLGACDMQLMLGTNDETTADYYSKKAGKGTTVVTAERRQHNKLSLLDTQAYTQVGTTESYQQMEVITPDEIERLRQLDQLLLFIGGSRPFRLNKVGFDKSPAYPVEINHARNHIPMWLIRAKEETNFRTEYGGVYKLGLISDMPPHFQKLIDKWRYEELNGISGAIDEEKLPIPYRTTYEALEKIKMLNKSQGDKMIDFVNQLVNSPDNVFVNYRAEDIIGEEVVSQDEEIFNTFTDTNVQEYIQEPNTQETVNTTETEIYEAPANTETLQPQITEETKKEVNEVKPNFIPETKAEVKPEEKQDAPKDLSGFRNPVKPKIDNDNKNFITASGRETELKYDPEGEKNNKQTSTLNFNVTFKKTE